jgi:glycosyltransferase involved in cell wall biosynthesis
MSTGDPAATSFEGVPTTRLKLPRHLMVLAARRIAAAAARHELVQAFNFNAALPALAAARRAGRPVACTMLGLFGREWLAMKGPVLGRAFAAMERRIVAARYDATVFLSDASRAAGVAMGACAARARTIAPGLDWSRIRPAVARAPYVLFAGRLDRRKGVHHLLAAARALPRIPFRATGWGADIPALRAAAPPNLILEEARGDDRYWQALGEARIFLSPTHAETFGLSVAEAMASGCAIVSSAATLDFAGHRHAPGDEAGMIAGLARLWDDPAACALAGAENRRLAARFTWDSHIDALLAVHAGLLRDKAG